MLEKQVKFCLFKAIKSFKSYFIIKKDLMFFKKLNLFPKNDSLKTFVVIFYEDFLVGLTNGMSNKK